MDLLWTSSVLLCIREDGLDFRAALDNSNCQARYLSLLLVNLDLVVLSGPAHLELDQESPRTLVQLSSISINLHSKSVTDKKNIG